MRTFREFRESEDDRDDERALNLVRKGIDLQRGNDFWEDFLRLCGDSEGMAALLGVARDRVTGLSSRIERLRGMVGESGKKRGKRDRMIKTGSDV